LNIWSPFRNSKYLLWSCNVYVQGKERYFYLRNLNQKNEIKVAVFIFKAKLSLLPKRGNEESFLWLSQRRSLWRRRRRKIIKNIFPIRNIRCPFHQRSTSSFYTRRSRMRKKRQSSQKCHLALLFPTCIKAARKMLVKLTPGGWQRSAHFLA